MKKPYVEHKKLMKDELKDPVRAGQYLRIALEEFYSDKNSEALMLAFRRVVDAQGGIGKLAKKAHMNRQTFYKALSSEGNPSIVTIGAVLSAMGMKLSVEHA